MIEKIFDNQKTTSNSEQLNALRAILPECFDKEGNVIRAKFEAILEGNRVDFSRENYTLNWLGKSYARVLANEKPLSVIREDEAFNANKNSGNLLIKGDNLEALKHLKNAYYQSVKMIYIDPPYNTGDDFIYHDSRHFTPEELANKAGIELDEAARLLEFNAKGSNTHSAWLTFMFPRLKLARELLREDGVIFISIDDNEQAQLKLLCDEVFGEGNFISIFSWQKNFAPKNDNKYISGSVDYILCYAKNRTNFKRNLLPREAKHNESYSNPDNDPRGSWTSGSILVTTYSKNAVFEIKSPSGKIHIPPQGRSWRYSKETFEKLIEDNRIWFGKNGDGVPRVKRFLQEMPDGVVPQNLLLYQEFGSSQDGNNDVKELFHAQIFDFPKPTKLLQKLLQISTAPTAGGGGGDIVLDFFAGSGTTAHAVMEQNIIDGGNRQFILIQLPESINEKRNKTAYDFAKNELKSKNPTIFDITKERILRAKNHLIAKYAEKDLSDFDLDFKIYELEERKFDIEEQARLTQGDLGLYDYDVNTIATTWKLYDGILLQTPLKAIGLGDYIAHYDNDKKLYLINNNFTNENLKNLIERLDDDKDFKPNMIVIYGRNFGSAKQCEVCHNLENLINKKSIDLKIIVRYF